MRVYELAKKLGKESKVLIAELGKLGIAVSSHSNALSEKDLQKALKALSGKADRQTPVRKKATGSYKPGKTAKKPSPSPAKARSQTTREKEKAAEEEVRKPEKKHILIKRRKAEIPPPSDPETMAEEASPGDGISSVISKSETPEPVSVIDEPPEVAAMSQALAAEATLPDVVPSIEDKAAPVATGEPVTTQPQQTVDEPKKVKEEEKPKKSRKAGETA